MDDSHDTLGEWMRDTREARGWTQDDIALAIDVAQSTVSAWESGRTAPPLRSIMRWASIVGVTTDELARVLRRWSRETS